MIQLPATQDTIVAIASAWAPSPVGIVRLSGPRSFEFAIQVGAAPPPAGQPAFTTARLTLGDTLIVPATTYWFRGPRSYTGQDVVELHTVGCPPLLRALSARLLELGTRRALPGEFTARAYLAGKLDADTVESVLALLGGEQDASTRSRARTTRIARERRLASLGERIVDLLTRIEAGIDFVEEEDIRFVAPAETRAALAALRADLANLLTAPPDTPRRGRPHVALVGLSNAGKSTLFNRLVGHDRALVSPVLGTTRDVLSAETRVANLQVVLQDCAGLGDAADDLELATHRATERAAQQADLVLWVHAADLPWAPRETRSCEAIPPHRRLLAWNKIDLRPGPPPDLPVSFAATAAVSGLDGLGVPELRAVLGAHLGRLPPAAAPEHAADLHLVDAALARAAALVAQPPAGAEAPELVALELRAALGHLSQPQHRPLDEQILARVFAEFCVGK